MKSKDIVLAGLITVNLMLVILVAALLLFSHEPAAQAGASTEAGYFRVCTLRYANNAEGVAVIDTVGNKLNFYIGQPGLAGKVTFQLVGPPIDLAQAFSHPR